MVRAAPVARFLVHLFREKNKVSIIQRHKATINRHRAVALELPTDYPKLKLLFRVLSLCWLALILLR